MTGSEEFARAFGDALKAYLDNRSISYTKAATLLGVTKAALSTYWTIDAAGRRRKPRKPRAELLFLACTELEEFAFVYKGHRVTADMLGESKKNEVTKPEQLRLDYSRQFKLTEDKGQVSVRLKRHPGSVEVSVSLKVAS